MKITIVYDNETLRDDCRADWGFSALVEFENRKILFDTGANGKILLDNMKKLAIDPTEISAVFISHSHWDHTGGLEDFFKINPAAELFVPASYRPPEIAQKVNYISEAGEIFKNIYSTGELNNNEQSMAINTDKGIVVIVGCSHPGIDNILNAASQFGRVYAIIGGYHGFDKFDVVADVDILCPTHCTQHKSEIKSLYPDKYIDGGVGKIIEI